MGEAAPRRRRGAGGLGVGVVGPRTADHWEYPDSLDALVAAPGSHRLLFENDDVRVLETTIGPGETVPLHTHRWPSVLYVVATADHVRRDDDGQRYQRHAGQAGAPPEHGTTVLAHAEAASHRRERRRLGDPPAQRRAEALNLTGLEHDAWIERNAVSAEDANPDHRRGRREPDAIHPDFREFTAANRVSIQETA